MDAGYIDQYGYVYVTARDDDVINVAGHRLSTSALEDVILAHPDVADATVIGVPEPTKGEVPMCLFVMKKSKPEINICLIDQSLSSPIYGNKCGAVNFLNGYLQKRKFLIARERSVSCHLHSQM